MQSGAAAQISGSGVLLAKLAQYTTLHNEAAAMSHNVFEGV